MACSVYDMMHLLITSLHSIFESKKKKEKIPAVLLEKDCYKVCLDQL